MNRRALGVPPMSDLDARSAESWSRFDLPVSVDDLQDWLVTGASIPDLFVQQAEKNPGRLALSVGDDSVTYEQLHQWCSRIAGWLIGRGVKRGDRVLVVGRNSLNLIAACLATMYAGAVEVVAGPMSTARELAHFASDARPTAVIADRGLLELVDPSLREAPASLPMDEVSPKSRPIRRANPVPPPGMRSDELAAIQYTSGTTGRPKGAALTHGNLVAYLRAVHLAWKWRDSDVLLHSLPLAHGHGRNGVYTALLAGATCVVLPKTDTAAIQETIRSSKAAIFYAVPAIWERILTDPKLRPSEFGGLRLFTSGSSPLDVGLAERIRQRLGEFPLERYGSTETGIVTTNPLEGPRIPGTVGRAMPGAEVRVVRGDGSPAPDGEIGEVVVRGPSVLHGYWGIEEGGADARGWYRTGDLGYFDPQRGGYLVIAGRTRDMIITGGVNVYPKEIEDVALELASIREVAVAGIPSARWGEEVVMAVVPRDPATFDQGDLVRHLRKQLAAYKVPKQIRVVDGLPRNEVGKVSRKDVVDLWEKWSTP